VLIRLIVALVLGVILIGCAPSAAVPTPAASQNAKPSVTVHYGYSSAGAVNSPVLIADAMGFFAEQGIAVDYVLFPSASEVIPAATRGDVDAAGVGINPATFNALAANFGIKLVADTATQYPGFPLNVLVVAKELTGTIKGPADLKGHKIALTPPGLGTASGLLLSKYLGQANLTPADVDIVPLPFPDQVAALTNRSVDAALMAEPFATQVVKSGVATFLIGTDKVLPGHQVTGLIYTDRFMSTQHDVAVGWMTAYLKGVRVYMGAFGGNATDRDKVIQILTQKTDLKDPQLWADMVPTGSSPDGQLNLQSIAESQAYFQKLGLVLSSQAPEAMVDTSFAEAAVKVLGPGPTPVPPHQQ
jgi:NitT/TauT family transport system substrate-binding protein